VKRGYGYIRLGAGEKGIVTFPRGGRAKLRVLPCSRWSFRGKVSLRRVKGNGTTKKRGSLRGIWNCSPGSKRNRSNILHVKSCVGGRSTAKGSNQAKRAPSRQSPLLAALDLECIHFLTTKEKKDRGSVANRFGEAREFGKGR